MIKNFYGVKKGFKPGIYTTWEECSSQVKGYKGAIYKGFKEEQEAFRFVYDREMLMEESIYYDLYLQEYEEAKLRYQEHCNKSVKSSTEKNKRKKVRKINMSKDRKLNKDVNMKNIAHSVMDRLVSEGFVVHYHYAKTGSIYIKLDCGVANSIRIANHDGYNYSYRYNIRLDISDFHHDKNGEYDMYFYPLSMLSDLIADIKKNKSFKIKKYGLNNYKKYMDINSDKRVIQKFKKYGE